MKLKLSKAMLLAALVTFSAIGQDSEPPDDQKVSYALGMKLGLEIKRLGADVDVNAVLRGLKDVSEDKSTRLQESELRPLLHQETVYQRDVLSKKNKAEGDAYLAKNAKSPGVTVLPDGLQYRVVQAGDGPMPKLDDNVIINFRGSLLDGTEVDRKEHFQVSVAGQLKGCQEALQLMKAGSKWQIVAPPGLAFGNNWKGDVGPETTVIFEIELLSVRPSAHLESAGAPALGRQPPHVVGQGAPANTIPDAASPSTGK